MDGKSLNAADSISIAKAQLARMKMKAVHGGLWFGALTKIDRALINLTIQVAESVRSFALLERIIFVMKKIEYFSKNPTLADHPKDRTANRKPTEQVSSRMGPRNC